MKVPSTIHANGLRSSYDILLMEKLLLKFSAKQVKEELKSRNLTLNNCVAIMSDSARVMRGMKSGMISCLKKEHPQIVDAGDVVCIMSTMLLPMPCQLSDMIWRMLWMTFSHRRWNVLASMAAAILRKSLILSLIHI